MWKVLLVKTSACYVKRHAAVALAAVPLEAVRIIWNNNNAHGPLSGTLIIRSISGISNTK